jgi:ABC-type transporter Mla subunit MlaD
LYPCQPGGLIGTNYISIDPGGSGDILQSREIILETESLIDIGELIGRYTFGRMGGKKEKVRLAHTRNSEIRNWVD